MKRTLVDSGPLIALFDKDDKYHMSAINFISSFKGVLVTTWSVVTEVLHMLDFNVNIQIDFLKWIERDGLTILSFSHEQISRLLELSQKYSDVPMDFADATLILVSELENIKEIVTIDSDFYICRNIRSEYLTNLFIS